jgi:phosphoheptose isomerase
MELIKLSTTKEFKISLTKNRDGSIDYSCTRTYQQFLNSLGSRGGIVVLKGIHGSSKRILNILFSTENIKLQVITLASLEMLQRKEGYSTFEFSLCELL